MVVFFFEDISSINLEEKLISEWLTEAVRFFNAELGNISLICCSDNYLLKVNQDFLDHDYYTDIITFNYNEDNIISGDLFISIDRVKDNANSTLNTFENELLRVIIHGVLHLLGFNDKSEDEQLVMREKENLFIEKFQGNVRKL